MKLVKVLNYFPKTVSDTNIIYAVPVPYYKRIMLQDSKLTSDEYYCIHRMLVKYLSNTRLSSDDYEIIGEVICVHLKGDKRDIACSYGKNLRYYRGIKQIPNWFDILYELGDVFVADEKYKLLCSKFFNNDEKITNYEIDYEKSFNAIYGNDNNRVISYTNPKIGLDLSFDCSRNDLGTNSIHAFIGRNGSGKTFLMNNMLLALLSRYSTKRGYFSFSGCQCEKVICVLVNSFDDIVVNPENKKKKIQFGYISNNYFINDSNNADDRKDYSNEIKTFDEEIQNTYESITSAVNAYEIIKGFAKRKHNLFQKIGLIFSEDYSFNQSGIFNEHKSTYSFNYAFSKLSHGHKKIILSIIAMINEIDDNSLVFFDEPESNLYPGLVSLYIKALKLILDDYNSIMFVFTHSPIIIQQLSNRCVWKIRRGDGYTDVKNINFNSLGENIGRITRELFDLELEETIYYDYLSKVSSNKTNDSIFKMFGEEAQSLLKIMEIKK